MQNERFKPLSKSILISADTGDFDNNKVSVDAAGVALILKQTVVNEVAQDLVAARRL